MYILPTTKGVDMRTINIYTFEELPTEVQQHIISRNRLISVPEDYDAPAQEAARRFEVELDGWNVHTLEAGVIIGGPTKLKKLADKFLIASASDSDIYKEAETYWFEGTNDIRFIATVEKFFAEMLSKLYFSYQSDSAVYDGLVEQGWEYLIEGKVFSKKTKGS